MRFLVLILSFGIRYAVATLAIISITIRIIQNILLEPMGLIRPENYTLFGRVPKAKRAEWPFTTLPVWGYFTIQYLNYLAFILRYSAMSRVVSFR